jgi:hypothetical protein
LTSTHRIERRSADSGIDAVQVNVAYRWFAGFRLTDRVPDASTFSQNRRRRGQTLYYTPEGSRKQKAHCVQSKLDAACRGDTRLLPAQYRLGFTPKTQ